MEIIGQHPDMRFLKQGKIHHNALVEEMPIDNFATRDRANYLRIGEDRPY